MPITDQTELTKILDYSILNLGNNLHIKVIHLIEISLIILISILVRFAIRKSIYKSTKLDIGKKYSLNNLIKYIIYIISISLIFNTLGINLKLILAGSAALLVGVGLGLQNLFSDFVSGIILLIDSSIKVGDIINVNGIICQVQKINLRTTNVLTRDDKYILLPNSLLTKTQLVNWTYANTASRFDINVRTEYSANAERVIQLLIEIATNHKEVENDPKPFVRLNDFGNSSLDFTLYFWSKDVFRVENVKSRLRKEILHTFIKNNITIPFPHQILHIEKKEE